MKIVKILFGLGAVAFVVAHAVEIPKLLQSGPASFASSVWLAKGAIMLVGSAIAIKLFQSAFRKQEGN